MNTPDEMIKIKEIQQITSMLPAQWEGKLEDRRQFYARYRWGQLTFFVSPIGVDPLDGELVYKKQLGDEWHGEITTQEMLDAIGAVLIEKGV
jgi:hypothetical protein